MLIPLSFEKSYAEPSWGVLTKHIGLTIGFLNKSGIIRLSIGLLIVFTIICVKGCVHCFSQFVGMRSAILCLLGYDWISFITSSVFVNARSSYFPNVLYLLNDMSFKAIHHFLWIFRSRQLLSLTGRFHQSVYRTFRAAFRFCERRHFCLRLSAFGLRCCICPWPWKGV